MVQVYYLPSDSIGWVAGSLGFLVFPFTSEVHDHSATGTGRIDTNRSLHQDRKFLLFQLDRQVSILLLTYIATKNDYALYFYSLIINNAGRAHGDTLKVSNILLYASTFFGGEENVNLDI